MKRSVFIVVLTLISLLGLVACNAQTGTMQSDKTNTTTEMVSDSATTSQSETTTEVVRDDATSTEAETAQETQPEEAVEAIQVSNLQFVNAYADW